MCTVFQFAVGTGENDFCVQTSCLFSVFLTKPLSGFKWTLVSLGGVWMVSNVNRLWLCVFPLTVCQVFDWVLSDAQVTLWIMFRFSASKPEPSAVERKSINFRPDERGTAGLPVHSVFSHPSISLQQLTFLSEFSSEDCNQTSLSCAFTWNCCFNDASISFWTLTILLKTWRWFFSLLPICKPRPFIC